MMTAATMHFCLCVILLLCADVAVSFNFTVEQLYDERHEDSSIAGSPDLLPIVTWNYPDQQRKTGLSPSIFKGRGLVMDLRLRVSGARNENTDGRQAGVFVYLRQVVNGVLGQWRQSATLFPDDIPYHAEWLAVPNGEKSKYPRSTSAFVGGVYMLKTSNKLEDPSDPTSYDIMGGRTGLRAEYNKHAVTGNPETTNALMLSAFGVDYSGAFYNSYLSSGAAYVFTGEYYHWTQAAKLRVPIAVDDDDYHFGRCVSIDKQTQDTAAISCPGCDPGNFKTAKIADSVQDGSQGRGAVFIYKSSVTTAYKHWTATQMLWPRHNMWYYFGAGFLTIDGNTLVTDACRGARCIFNTFLQREYDAPTTHLFVYVKQEATGLWSEQQVLTNAVMETETHSKSFSYLTMHDDTIAYGNTLSVPNSGARNRKIEGTVPYRGEVFIFYPNKPNYLITETFRHQADVSFKKESNSFRLNQHHWSLQQVLFNEDLVLWGAKEPDAGSIPDSTSGGYYKHYFGKFVSISGDRMAIGMRGKAGGSAGSDHAEDSNPVTTLFTRQRQGGLWSRQQILISTEEKMSESSGITLYNSHFTATGTKQFLKYMSEMAHGRWKCLVVTMFDEFGDGWDTAKLRVDAPDGTYDYYYPTCDVPTTEEYDNHPNPFIFEYCPSAKELGGLYKFHIVDAKEAKFNWEIEWKVELELQWIAGSDGQFGSTNITGDIDTKMEFYWNPVTLSFEMGSTHNVLPSTISCHSCPVRGDSHRMLLSSTASSGSAEQEDGGQGSSSRGLRHAARTASPTVSPAPTLVQDDAHRLADWENLVMSTSDPLRPWFVADRTGTYFFLSDLEGKKLLRKETQCAWSATPLNHSCWLNYPDAIPDGDYIARIGGARAGQNTGLHTWTFCGVMGGQGEHLEFKVLHGSCYPIQRFTTSRYCSFRQGSTVVAVIQLASEVIQLNALTTAQKNKMFKVLAEILPNTKQGDFSISTSGVGDAMHGTVHVTLHPSDHGLDPADFDAITKLENTFSSYVREAAEGGVLAKALSDSLDVDSSSSGGVSVGLVTFDTATIPVHPRGTVADDDERHEGSDLTVNRDWLESYTPASEWDKTMIATIGWMFDIVSVLGYVGLAACFIYGAKQARRKYLQSRSSLQRGLESASSSLLDVKQSATSSGGGLVRKVHRSLDSFSDNVFAMMNEATKPNDLEQQLAIPEVVLPDLKTLFVDNKEDKKSRKKQKQKRKQENEIAMRQKAQEECEEQNDEEISDDKTSEGHFSSSSSESTSSSSSSAESSSSGESSSSSDEEEIDLKDIIRQGKSPYPSFKAPKAYTLY